MKIRMLKTGIFLLFFLSSCSLFSQLNKYIPFPEKYGKWILEKTGPYGPGETMLYEHTQFETKSDTIIGALTYKKVTAAEHFGPPYMGVWNIVFGTQKLAFAYRNDIPNKKVYILTDTNKLINGNLRKEWVWYDFNLKIGDTVKNTFSLPVALNVKRSIISATDSIFICGNYTKRFMFSCTGPFEDRLIEGVGFADNFLNTGTDCPFEPVYLYRTYFSCSPTSISDDIQAALTFSLFPNPVKSELTLKSLHHQLLHYTILNSLGNIMVYGNVANERINVEALNKGFYIIIVTDGEGNFYKNKFIKED